MSKKRPAFVDLTTDSDSESDNNGDDNDSSEDTVEPPKVHRGRATLYSWDDLNIPENEMRLRPEYQDDATLRKTMKTLTYEDLIVRAMQSPIALQRFFGLAPPSIPEDQSEISIDSDDTARRYILADNLLAPFVFEILLKRDFGIAYKAKNCSAKTEAERKMVSTSLLVYAPIANKEKGVSKAMQLKKLRELYVWIASAGKPYDGEPRDRTHLSVSFAGDGFVLFNDFGKPILKLPVVSFFRYHYNRLSTADEELFVELEPRPSMYQIQKVLPFQLQLFDSNHQAPLPFVGENARYFKVWLKSYQTYNTPIGFFELEDGAEKANVVAVAGGQLFSKVGLEYSKFVPGYIVLIDSFWGTVYFVSTDSSKKSFCISGRKRTRADISTLKYIDENRGISPRVVFFFYSEVTRHRADINVIVVVDLPVGGTPKIRQYKPNQEYILDSSRTTETFQRNFISWKGFDANTKTVFDPTNGKIAQYINHDAHLTGIDESGQKTNVELEHPAVAFNFASPKSVMSEVTTCTEGSFFPVNELLARRSGLVIEDFVELTVLFEHN